MKKLILGLMVVTLTVALSLSVMATEPCPLIDEHLAYEWVEDETSGYWRSMENDGVVANAKAYSAVPVGGSCNKETWKIDVSVHASVAQWIEFSISGTRYVWRVRKPGTYAANSLSAWLKSNGDVAINFDGFANLQSLGTSINPVIPIWYAYGETTDPNTLTWIDAASLNGMDTKINDCLGLHTADGYNWKLWNKIEVVNCNSACEYQNDATITLVLENQKPWINLGTGYFAN